MSIAELAVLLALVAISGITLLVISANPRRPPNIAYAVMGTIIAVWLAANAYTFQALTPDQARASIIVASIAAGWVPVAAQGLRIAIRRTAGHGRMLAAPILRLAVLGAGVTLLCLHPAFLPYVEFTNNPPMAEPRYGPLFPWYGLYLFASMLLFFVSVVRDRRRITGIARVEMDYLLSGTAIAMAMGTTAGIGTVWVLGTSRHVPLSNAVTILTLSSTIAYGLVVQRVMAVERAGRMFIARALAVLLLSGIYVATSRGSLQLFDFVEVDAHGISHWLAAIVVAMSGHRVLRSTQSWVESWWPADGDRAMAQLQGATSRRLVTVQALTSLLAEFPALLAQTLQAHHVRICGLTEGCLRTIAVYPVGLPNFDLPVEHPLVDLLRTEAAPVPRYAIERGRLGGAHWPELLATFQAAQADLAALAVGPRETLHLVMLGPRTDGRIYDTNDMVLLGHLCDEFAFAIENARLYTEIDDARRYNEILLHNIADGVIACDAAGQITALNREAGRLLHAGAVTAPATLDDLPLTLRDTLRRALAAEPTPGEIELRLDHEPEPNIVRLSASPLRRADGTPLGAIATLHDITVQRRFEERARRADRLASVGTLAASMAHEIKNPLVTIKTFIQLLPRAFDDPDLRASVCPLIAAEVERIDSVVNRLLDFARPVHPALEPIRLHEVLTRTLRLIDPRRRARGIRIVTNLQADDDRILGDRRLLEQVFVNLCFNAIEAMPEGGTLTLSSARVEVDSGQRDLWGQRLRVPRLRVSVADTGVGIPPEVLPKIFDPFFTTKPDGSGLGLTIAHGILHEHHAAMDIESQPGVGTVVHVLFHPMRPSEQDGQPE